jgi:16S rRNA (cytosine967-C5)-methyltransferase
LPPAKRSEVEELAVACSLPDFVVARLAARFGVTRAREIGQALLGRAPVTIRVNRVLATREEVAAAIPVASTPTMLAPDGLILSEHADLSSWPELEKGLIEPQDEGSQLLALATGAAPKELVLDACAGAGGKTLALAAMMGGTGRLVALDPEPKKLEELKKRARRAQVTNMEAIEGELEALPEKLKSVFDRVLVDAPCTGSGAWRRHPDARWRVTERELELHTTRQKRLIAGAASALKPGGLLVYATCSVLPEENEDVVDAVHAADSRLVPVRLEETLGPIAKKLQLGEHGDRARIGPGPTDRDPDGFFVAVMRRR